jgi:hypothetical protein
VRRVKIDIPCGGIIIIVDMNTARVVETKADTGRRLLPRLNLGNNPIRDIRPRILVVVI